MELKISQQVAILIDGNNMEYGIKERFNNQNAVLNYDVLIPKIIGNRSLNRLVYFREGKSISEKLAERLHTLFYGVVRPCFKSADIPLTIEAVKLADKVDTIIIFSGDSDYVDLIKYLKNSGVRVESVSVKETTHHVVLQNVDRHYFIEKEDIFIVKSKYVANKPNTYENNIIDLPAEGVEEFGENKSDITQ